MNAFHPLPIRPRLIARSFSPDNGNPVLTRGGLVVLSACSTFNRRPERVNLPLRVDHLQRVLFLPLPQTVAVSVRFNSLGRFSESEILRNPLVFIPHRLATNRVPVTEELVLHYYDGGALTNLFR